MAEADSSLHSPHPSIYTATGAATLTPAQSQRMRHAMQVLAMLAARGAVKDELRRQGRRLWDVEAREITAMAREYLSTHPAELIARTGAVPC